MSKSKGPRELILQYLEILKLKMTEEQLDHFLQQHSQTELSVSELLAKFLEGPAGTSQEVSLQSRIRRAAFPTDATLESYDWTRNPKTIRKESFLELANGQFIQRKENAAFVGASGLGKTHLIQGVGRKCCALGYRVRYETSARLIETLNFTPPRTSISASAVVPLETSWTSGKPTVSPAYTKRLSSCANT